MLIRVRPSILLDTHLMIRSTYFSLEMTLSESTMIVSMSDFGIKSKVKHQSNNDMSIDTCIAGYYTVDRQKKGNRLKLNNCTTPLHDVPSGG